MWPPAEFSLPGGLRMILGTVRTYAYWPFFGLTLTSAAIDLLAFLYPCWTRVRSRVRIGIDTVMLAMAAVLLNVGNWVEIAGPNLSAADLAKALTLVNDTIQITLIAIILISIGDALMEIRRLLRASHARPAPLVAA